MDTNKQQIVNNKHLKKLLKIHLKRIDRVDEEHRKLDNSRNRVIKELCIMARLSKELNLIKEGIE